MPQICARRKWMQNIYKEMYLHLFNAVSDALALLEGGGAAQAEALLKRAQCKCEELYIESADGSADGAGV